MSEFNERDRSPNSSSPGEQDAGRNDGRRSRFSRRQFAVAVGGLVAIALVAAAAATMLWPSDPATEEAPIQQPGQPTGGPTDPDSDAQDSGDNTDDPPGDGGGTADEPDGVVAREQVVGQATLVIPAEFTIRLSAPDDPTPCLGGQPDPTLFLASDGAPAHADGQCPESQPTTSSVLVTTASTVPPAWLPGEGQVKMTAEWVDIELDGVEAQRATDPSMPRLVVIRSIPLDLYLEIIDGHRDPELIASLIASIRQRD